MEELEETAWRRGWEDSKRGWTDWRFVVADMVALPLLAYFVSLPVALGVAALSLFTVWIGATASAPIRQRNEARQLLQLREFLDIAIEVPQHIVQARPPIESDDIEKVGWMFHIDKVRITNQSQTNKVSLGVTLHVGLVDNPSGQRELVLREEDGFGSLGKQEGQLVHWLRSPINIGPAESVTGHLGFWVLWPIEMQLGGDLSAVIRRSPDYQMDSYLEIEDHVTGQKIRLKPPGRYPLNDETAEDD